MLQDYHSLLQNALILRIDVDLFIFVHYTRSIKKIVQVIIVLRTVRQAPWYLRLEVASETDILQLRNLLP